MSAAMDAVEAFQQLVQARLHGSDSDQAQAWDAAYLASERLRDAEHVDDIALNGAVQGVLAKAAEEKWPAERTATEVIAVATGPAVRELTEAIRFTVEYVGTTTLRPAEGWSWYDALVKYAPDKAAALAAEG